jgi:alpha-beta hydrolase superfamily lysophospholipase
MRIGPVSNSLLMLIAGGTASLILTAAPACAAPCAQTDLVEFEKMTWVEVKCEIAAGKTTALIYTGGVEERGPQNANGGHNLIAHATVEGDPIDGGDANRRALEASPIATIDQWHSPVLLVQADNDDVVPSPQAAELIEGLRSHNIEHDVIMIPNEIHDLARYASWMMLFNAADVYFDRQLNKRSASSP